VIDTKQQAAFARAAEARSAIADIIAKVSTGELDLRAAFAAADADPLIGRCFAVKVFEAVPDIGKVRARRTMDNVGLAEDIWFGAVPLAQRAEMLTALAEPTSDRT
jgi:hypothetical protein